VTVLLVLRGPRPSSLPSPAVPWMLSSSLFHAQLNRLDVKPRLPTRQSLCRSPTVPNVPCCLWSSSCSNSFSHRRSSQRSSLVIPSPISLTCLQNFHPPATPLKTLLSHSCPSTPPLCLPSPAHHSPLFRSASEPDSSFLLIPHQLHPLHVRQSPYFRTLLSFQIPTAFVPNTTI
jgi:hypothetical protein